MRPKHRIPILMAAFALASSALAAHRDFGDDPRLADLPARWSAILDLFDVPGMAVVAVDGDDTFIATFGRRDAAGEQPVTPDTLFYVASITKTFTATAALAVVEAGGLDLDRPVTAVLPRLRLRDPQGTAGTTLRDLLSHRPGIVSPDLTLLEAYTGELTDDRYYAFLAQAEIVGGPRYSNTHFSLVGRMLEAAEGTDWHDVIRRRVLEPAGMRRTTTWASTLYADPDVAWPLERTPEGDWRVAEPLKSDRTMHAAGGLATTAVEIARWLRLHLDGGEIDGLRVLSAESVRAMQTVQAALPEPQGSIRIVEGMGLAWQVGNFNGRRLCIHSGTYVGTSAFLALLPEQHAGLAVLIDAGGAARGMGDIVSIDLLERLTGTRAAWDVYARYTERAREMRGRKPATDDAAPAPPVLTRPAGIYTGVYHNDAWGNLVVERDGDRLALRLGELPLEVGAGEPDRLTVTDLFDEPAVVRFVVDPRGAVERLILERRDHDPLEFRR